MSQNFASIIFKIVSRLNFLSEEERRKKYCINLNIFRTYLLFIHTFLRTLKHRKIILNSLVKVENASLKRAVALQRSCKSLPTSEESRGDLIPPFSEIANLVLARRRDNRKLSGRFIYRSDNRYRAHARALSLPLIA